MHLSVGEFALGEDRFFTGTIIDLSAQRDVERRLEREQALFLTVFESLPDPVIVCDVDGAIRLVNQSFSRVFGFGQQELLGESLQLLLARGDDPLPVLLPGETRVGQAELPQALDFRRKSGEAFPAKIFRSRIVGASGTELGSLMLVRDVTEERRQEAIILQAQRMEAVGQLTGGVAHDFNNLLTVILGNLELLEAKLTDPDAQSLAAEAREAGEMGARLTDRLLTFARRRRLEPREVRLNELVLALTELLRRTLGSPIDLSTSLAADLWPTLTDAGQVENAILNLAINARDAMPNGGRLLIETYNATLDAGALAGMQGVAAGDYVVLSVTDTGHGMPQDVRERAFEPFFTTKGTGRGSGLGLASIYGFARQSGGHVTIYSEVGKGTTVNLYLPRGADTAAADRTAAGACDVQVGRGELVLVVEDDEKVRRLTCARLQALGFRVAEAGDAPAAVRLLEQTPEVAIVFTDLVMPGGMSGLDLAKWVREQRPDLQVILTSGYSAGLMMPDSAQSLDLRVLRKPYRQVDLARVLGEALAGRNSHPS
jgi:PAS domain S-box-containing protein